MASEAEAISEGADPVPDSNAESTATSPFTPEQFKEAEEILKKQCEAVWGEISKVSKQLQVSRPELSPQEPQAADVYQAKASLLKAQAQVFRDMEPCILPQNEVIQFEVLRQELHTNIVQLREVLTLVHSEEKELDTEMTREQLFKTEKEQVKEALETKLESAMAAERGDEAALIQTTLKEVQVKEGNLNKYHRTLMKKMAVFINKHFPHESEHSENSTASLQTILQELMNLCVDRPHDPYLEITADLWPPYVELLLRGGIALRKPDNDGYLRMTPFHL